jgi:hypothetical protein
MPHAIDVDGYTITMFDPINHDSLEADADSPSVVAVSPRDRRWVRIRRLVVMPWRAHADQLDLAFNPAGEVLRSA